MLIILCAIFGNEEFIGLYKLGITPIKWLCYLALVTLMVEMKMLNWTIKSPNEVNYFSLYSANKGLHKVLFLHTMICVDTIHVTITLPHLPTKI